jgi:hypothetical protein
MDGAVESALDAGFLVAEGRDGLGVSAEDAGVFGAIEANGGLAFGGLGASAAPVSRRFASNCFSETMGF